ncbi:DUF4127 family protein [Streptomyces sp. NPDC058221]|uniref:DUF4127 family protein n=1 Tax=Streptomyces sp. NPDC058221 TaxID=3346388 RepID=UPI0036EEEB5A
MPLDERPVNARLPQQVAAIAGFETVLPPVAALSRKREPGDTEVLARWLEECVTGAEQTQALVIALDMLGYGGLIAARTTQDSTALVLSRWEVLRRVRAAAPACAIHAVSLVTRAPNSYNNDEEPEYWERIGVDLHQYGASLDREFRSEPHAPEKTPDEFRKRLPADAVDDFARRRLRNHTANLAAVSLAADRVLDTLLITADDTAERSAGSLEQQWLGQWHRALADVSGSVLMHPGADEVGAVLTARAVLAGLGVALRVAPVCAVPGGAERVAPYENIPIAQGAKGHVHGTGSTVATAEEADLVVVIHPPDPAGGDWAHRHPVVRSGDDPEVRATVEEVLRHARRGVPVAVADCAYPNGSDPALVAALAEQLPLTSLAGYAGWNTAGNTMGSVIAQATVYTAALRAGTVDHTAHRGLLLHRLVEDCAYMAGIRGRALATFTDQVRHSTLSDDLVEPVREWIAKRLATAPAQFQGFEGWRLTPNTVTLPWKRTFEVDFTVAAPEGT